MGGRAAYGHREAAPDVNDRPGPAERALIASRDSLYIASVAVTGWPHVQFRGGPTGFLRVIDEATLGYADFRGNRRYIAAGNVTANDRVSLFPVDYARRERPRIFGRARKTCAEDDPDLMARLATPSYPARVESAVLITVSVFDWNCPKHITPRFSEAELVEALAPAGQELARLGAENEPFRRLLERAQPKGAEP